MDNQRSLRWPSAWAGVVAAWWLAWAGVGSVQGALPEFDFTQSIQGWTAAHDLAGLQGSTNGLLARITGADPYLIGPARDYPAGALLWLRLRLKSDQGGSCQIFYFNTNPTEANSARFTVPAGKWVEGRVPLPALGLGYKMRIDPPGTSGTCLFSHLRFEARGELPDFDFATVPDSTEWQAEHDIASLMATPEGLLVQISNGDPYLRGPARNYPAGTQLWLRLRLKSSQGGTCQVFYYPDYPKEADSVRFAVPADVWYDAKIPLTPLGGGYRLRIDPPGNGGSCWLAALKFEERLILTPPAWPRPEAPEIAADALQLSSGTLSLFHNRDGWGRFTLQVEGTNMAIGNSSALLGYQQAKQLHWLPLTNFTASLTGSNLIVSGRLLDAGGATWKIEQRFRVGTMPGTIAVETEAMVDQDRTVVYLPLLTLLPGAGSFGTNKVQGLLAGVEYLENEPSSSEADLTGPQARRLAPDSAKITFPLMAIAAQGQCLGLIWEPQDNLSAVFDSPDRQYQSGGHLLELLFPGSNGQNREEGSLLPYDGELLRAAQPYIARAILTGRRGDSVVPALQDYVRLRGLPALPATGMSATQFCQLAAHGWLDSDIRQDNLYRHAVAPGFNFGPMASADAALYMDWLALKVEDAALASRLTNGAAGARAQVNPANYFNQQIGHVRYPLPALLYGRVNDNANASAQQGQSLLGRFQPDGSILYQKPATGMDYGKTHFAPDANGLTAAVVAGVLEAAVFSGDRSLRANGLRVLQALNKFRNTVPRGAQTWEIPLHTPDILAAAHLVRAYTLGYQLTGDPDYLDQARYWAWTGLNFVYLHPPTAQPVGLYNTIPVLGATGFVAPNWIGLPVQWCGLVYADALYQFASLDPGFPWRLVADGITVGGMQHTYPASDTHYQGLLPDSFSIRAQSRNGPAINPATVLSGAVRFLGNSEIYQFYAYTNHGLLVHVPGKLTAISERSEGVQFTVQGWFPRPAFVLITGVWNKPAVKLNGVPLPLIVPHEYRAAEGRLILQIQDSATLEIKYPATNALHIQRTGQPRAVILSWPKTNGTYVLQSRAKFSDSEAWADWSESPLYTTNQDPVIAIDATGQRFFRLRQQ